MGIKVVLDGFLDTIFKGRFEWEYRWANIKGKINGKSSYKYMNGKK